MPGLIAVLIQGLRYLFMSRLGLFVATALVWLGISFATVNVVLQPTIDLLTDLAGGGAGGGGGEYFGLAQQWMGVLQVDRALTMICSALVTKKLVSAGRMHLAKRT